MDDTGTILAKLEHLEKKLDKHQSDSDSSRKEVRDSLAALATRMGQVERFQSEISGGRKIIFWLVSAASAMAAIVALFKYNA